MRACHEAEGLSAEGAITWRMVGCGDFGERCTGLRVIISCVRRKVTAAILPPQESLRRPPMEGSGGSRVDGKAEDRY